MVIRDLLGGASVVKKKETSSSMRCDDIHIRHFIPEGRSAMADSKVHTSGAGVKANVDGEAEGQ